MKTLEQRLALNSDFAACFEPIFAWLQMYRAAFPSDAPADYVDAIATLLQQLRKTQGIVLAIPSAFPETTLLKSFGKAKAGLNATRARLVFLRQLPHDAITQETRAFLQSTADAIKAAERVLTRTMKALPAKAHLCSEHEASATGATVLPLPLPRISGENDEDASTLFNFWWRDKTTDLDDLAGRADNAMGEIDWIDYHVSELASMVKGEPRSFKRAQRDIIKLAVSEVRKCDDMLVVARGLYLAADHYD